MKFEINLQCTFSLTKFACENETKWSVLPDFDSGQFLKMFVFVSIFKYDSTIFEEGKIHILDERCIVS